MTAIGCQQFSEMAPDVALGLLSGHDRAQALDHLAHCPACREHLEGLTRVADGLLLLAPSGEPPIGFEARVMDRLAHEGAFSGSDALPHGMPPAATWSEAAPGPGRGAGHRWASPAAVLVAAVVIVVASLVGLLAGRTTASRRSAVTAQAVEVRSDDNSGTCRLVSFAGRGRRPAELVIHLDEPDEPTSSYSVVAQPTSGRPDVALGTIEVRNGQGSLDVNIPAGTGPVHGVRIVQSGRLRYQANFTSV